MFVLPVAGVRSTGYAAPRFATTPCHHRKTTNLRQNPSTSSQVVATYELINTPVRTPVANAFAERWIGTLRRELLDRTVIWNRHQLEKLVVDYIDHYNTRRPHRSLDQRPPVAADPPDRHLQVVRTARYDGLINEYRNAA